MEELRVTTLYCKLLTPEQATEFEILMGNLGYKPMERPAFWAEHIPGWMQEKRPRGINEDPLVVIILNLYHNTMQRNIYAACRCKDGVCIEPEMMKNLIMAANYTPLKTD